MDNVLGIGLTHYPPALGPHERYASILERIRQLPIVPQHLKNPDGWPREMQEEYRRKEEATKTHQALLIEGFQRARKAIDDFAPDAVVIFGDDQHENFQTELVPPFCIAIQEEFSSRPFAIEYLSRGNPWGAAPDKEFRYPGAAKTAWNIVHALSEQYDSPVAYSYRPLHYGGLSHAFSNALHFLDWHQDNPWRYPIIPIAVNAYGRDLHRSKGLFAHLLDSRPDSEKDPYLDGVAPGGPTPAACFQLGSKIRAIANLLDLRLAIIASSSWSHAFLTEKHFWLWPDIESDRLRLAELQNGEHKNWRLLSNETIYQAGHHEFRNWICLAGAVPDRTPQYLQYVESWICNSSKCFAIL